MYTVQILVSVYFTNKQRTTAKQCSPDSGTSSPPADSATLGEAPGGAGGGGGGARLTLGLPDVSFLICLSWACTVLKVFEPMIIDICPPCPSTGAISCSKLGRHNDRHTWIKVINLSHMVRTRLFTYKFDIHDPKNKKEVRHPNNKACSSFHVERFICN